MMKLPTTLDRKAWKKWLLCPALALLLVLSSLPVYAGEQQTERTETPTVTQGTGSESVESVTSGENDEIIADELESVDLQEVAATSDSDWRTDKPHEGEVLHGGYVGFKNKASGKYLTVPNGSTAAGTNVCQYSATSVANEQEFCLQYVYTVNMSYAFFRIRSVNSEGQMSLPVKAESNSLGQQNVCLRSLNISCATERWQIEHVEGNYYCIYIADNPDSATTKYALTSYGTGNGTTDGVSINSTGNVYIAPYVAGNSNQLWQICADGNPVTLENSVDISSDSLVMDILKGSIAYAYYVPKQFNDTINWRVSNTIKGYAYTNGGCYGLYPGSVDFIASVTHADGSTDEYTCNCYVYLPSGAYSVSSSNDLYLDTQEEYANIGSYMVFKQSEDFSEENRTQLFRFAYVGGGQYLISSMVYHDNHLSIESNSGKVLIGAMSGSSQGLKWELDENYSGCVIKISGGANWCWTMDSSSGDTPILKYASYANASNQSWRVVREFESMLGIEYIDPLDSVVLHNYRALEVITYSTTLDDINVTWSSLDMKTFFQDNTVALV